MKKGLTEIVFILDRSGSMSGLESDTIGGYNSMIEKQKKEEGEALISTVLSTGRRMSFTTESLSIRSAPSRKRNTMSEARQHFLMQ